MLCLSLGWHVVPGQFSLPPLFPAGGLWLSSAAQFEVDSFRIVLVVSGMAADWFITTNVFVQCGFLPNYGGYYF